VEKEDGTTHEKVTVEPTDCLPFLDMKLYWDEHDELAFTVDRKMGQQLKYLNNDSTHPLHMFRAISLSVYARLANLTSHDSTNRYKTLRELRPDHCNALDHAKLSSKVEKSPTLHYMKQCIDLTYSKKELKKQKDAARNRGVYFCIGYSTFWRKPIHLILKDLKLKHKLQWIWMLKSSLPGPRLASARPRLTNAQTYRRATRTSHNSIPN
jgi:hypothetical protein